MKNEIAAVETLDLPAKYEGRVQLCFNAAEELIPASEIYLYGSYAENCVLPSSTLKLLILIGDCCSKREMKTLGWEVEDLVCRISNEAFPIEVNVMGKNYYEQRMKTIGRKPMGKKDLRQIRWIDK